MVHTRYRVNGTDGSPQIRSFYRVGPELTPKCAELDPYFAKIRIVRALLLTTAVSL